ncbi:hypothetical protein DFH29DRAFT_882982 [Suillus ampliporus]|nr:hypothetical protein DFH29DRAFT_882982 [Suillus ampliporus]
MTGLLNLHSPIICFSLENMELVTLGRDDNCDRLEEEELDSEANWETAAANMVFNLKFGVSILLNLNAYLSTTLGRFVLCISPSYGHCVLTTLQWNGLLLGQGYGRSWTQQASHHVQVLLEIKYISYGEKARAGKRVDKNRDTTQIDPMPRSHYEPSKGFKSHVPKPIDPDSITRPGASAFTTSQDPDVEMEDITQVGQDYGIPGTP